MGSARALCCRAARSSQTTAVVGAMHYSTVSPDAVLVNVPVTKLLMSQKLPMPMPKPSMHNHPRQASADVDLLGFP